MLPGHMIGGMHAARPPVLLRPHMLINVYQSSARSRFSDFSASMGKRLVTYLSPPAGKLRLRGQLAREACPPRYALRLLK
jgi:hypothetical protein